MLLASLVCVCIPAATLFHLSKTVSFFSFVAFLLSATIQYNEHGVSFLIRSIDGVESPSAIFYAHPLASSADRPLPAALRNSGSVRTCLDSGASRHFLLPNARDLPNDTISRPINMRLAGGEVLPGGGRVYKSGEVRRPSGMYDQLLSLCRLIAHGAQLKNGLFFQMGGK